MKALPSRGLPLVQWRAIKTHFLGRKRQAQSNSLLTTAATATTTTTTKQSPVVRSYPSLPFTPESWEFRLGVLKNQGWWVQIPIAPLGLRDLKRRTPPPLGLPARNVCSTTLTRFPDEEPSEQGKSVILLILFMPQSIKTATTSELQTLLGSPDLL